MDKFSKEAGTAGSEWIICQSKSHPGRQYRFNKLTGETIWSSPKKERKADAKDKERTMEMQNRHAAGPALQIAKILRTPAQERLKRLQSNLKVDSKIIKTDRRCNENNSNKTNMENANVASNHVLPKSNVVLPSPLIAPRGSESCTTVAKKSTKSRRRKSFERYSSNKSPPNFSKPASSISKTTPAIAEASTSAQGLAAPAPQHSEPSQAAACTEANRTETSSAPGLGAGIINKIKSFCRNTFKSSFNKSQISMPVKKSTFKPTKQKSKHGLPTIKSAALQSTCKDLQEESIAIGSSVSKSISDNVSGSFAPGTPTDLIIPTYQRGSANARLERLRQSLLKQSAATSECVQKNNANNNNAANDDLEPMDWQSIEDEPKNSKGDIGFLRNNVRENKGKQMGRVSPEPANTMSEYYDIVNENLLRFAAERQQFANSTTTKWFPDHYYFVIDTNVLLSSLTFMDELIQMKLCDTKGTILFIPYVVLQELDKLKIRCGSESTKTLTVRAIKYLNAKFVERNRHIYAQTASDERQHLIDITSADDSILNCCLQVRQHVDNVLLLTEDVNLRNKAICNNLLVSTKSDLVSKQWPSMSTTSADETK